MLHERAEATQGSLGKKFSSFRATAFVTWLLLVKYNNVISTLQQCPRKEGQKPVPTQEFTEKTTWGY